MFNDPCAIDQDDSSSDFMFYIYGTMLALICSLLVSYKAIQYAERSNRLEFDSRFARIFAGMIQLFMWTMHVTKTTLDLPNGKSLLVFGAHMTALEAFAAGAITEGMPLSFFATTDYNKFPGVERLLNMFNTIPVESNPDKTVKRSSGAIEAGIKALNEGKRVAIFPQGNFCKIDKEPPLIFNGAAIMAINTDTPIRVYRVDGLKSVHNRFIPLIIRNHALYRAFLSALHPNDITIRQAFVIDYHLKPENRQKPKNELVREINARLYAVFRHLRELTKTDMDKIKQSIEDGKHLKLWDRAVELYKLRKETSIAEQEWKQEEAASTEALRLS